MSCAFVDKKNVLSKHTYVCYAGWKKCLGRREPGVRWAWNLEEAATTEAASEPTNTALRVEWMFHCSIIHLVYYMYVMQCCCFTCNVAASALLAIYIL